MVEHPIIYVALPEDKRLARYLQIAVPQQEQQEQQEQQAQPVQSPQLVQPAQAAVEVEVEVQAQPAVVEA